MINVYILVEGGVVQEVRATVPDSEIDVTVIDLDDAEAEGLSPDEFVRKHFDFSYDDLDKTTNQVY